MPGKEGELMAAHRKYAWEKWFAQSVVTVVRGRDYTCSQSTMVATIRNNASRLGHKVRLVDTGSSVIIKVITNEIPYTDKIAVLS